ncbi:MAG: caspase family protein [Pyrinomonadaceae bacterium]
MKKYFSLFLFILVSFLASGDGFVSNAGTNLAESDQQKPELVLQTGHSRSVLSVVFSPDNKSVASGSFDNTIKIWEFGTGRELRALDGHTGAVKTLDYSTDGQLLASGGNDKTIRIWDVTSGAEIKSFTVEDGSIEKVAISSDGSKISAGVSDGKIYVWEVSSGRELFKFTENTAAVTALEFNRDGTLLASGSADNIIKIRELNKGKKVEELKGHTDKIMVLQFSSNGDTLASGSADKTVRLWKTSNGRKLYEFEGHKGKVLAINFTADGKIMSADSAQNIKIWDSQNKREINSVNINDGKDSVIEAESAAFSSDGKFLASGKGDRTVVLSDTQTGEKLNTLENHTSGLYGVAFSSDLHWLASAGVDNTIKLWDLQTGQGLPPLKGHTGYVTSVIFHPNNQQIISASIDRTIRVWDAETGKTLYDLTGHTDNISSIAVGNSGKLLVSGSADQTIRLWDLETKKQTGILFGHSGEVVFVAISPDEKLIASAGADKTIKIWDANAKTLLRTLKGHNAEVDTVAFSHDGKYIASGSIDKTVRLWDAENGNLLKTIYGHESKINAVLFSDDDKQIISGSQDKTVRIWDITEDAKKRALTGHAGTVYALALTADGKWLASASADGSVIVWNYETGKRLSTLISLRESDDWLVAAPEGFFDGSPPAWDQMLWRFGNNTFNVKPIEVFFNEFYSPGLLANLLKGEKLPATSDISKKDRRQPVVKISLADSIISPASVSERRVKIKLKVAEVPPGDGYQNGSGARDIRLLRNGSLVKFWSGDILEKSGETELETTISLVGGQNQLTAYGFNNDNVKSSDSSLVVNNTENLKRKGVFYIISVGVAKYENPRFNLNYVEYDATTFSSELQFRQSELNHYERIEVISLFNENATKSNIIAAIERLAGIEETAKNLPSVLKKLRKAEPEDTIAVFYSGHGTSQNGHFYLLPYDLGYTDAFKPLDEKSLKKVLANSISDVELEQAFREIDAGQILLVIDACNSGQILESFDERQAPMNNKGLAQLAYDKGMYILTASQSIESAYVSKALKRSYLSYALVEEGLKTPVADANPKDGKITVKEWFDYAGNRVPQLRKDVNEGLYAVEDKKGLEEEETEEAKKKVKEKSSQRPRVFYRRQNNSQAFVISQTRR